MLLIEVRARSAELRQYTDSTFANNSLDQAIEHARGLLAHFDRADLLRLDRQGIVVERTRVIRTEQ
jgi:hypothetical protein